ncbi:MAG: VOC family protein [Cyclobacteriaceae bacterium]
MKFEHFALNVTDPNAIADWYIKNLGAQIVHQVDNATQTKFLADDSGHVFLEIYNNPKGEFLKFEKLHVLGFHVAFVSRDSAKDRDRLIREGATVVEEVIPNEGSLLVMMRDPFGIPLQLCQRSKSLTN